MLDRWHLLKNLGEVLQKLLAQQVDVLQQAAREAVPPEPSDMSSKVAPTSRSQGVQEESTFSTLTPESASPQASPARSCPPRQQRIWQLHMYEQVHRLSAEGWSQRAIVEHLHLHPNTVRKYQRMEQFQDQRHNPHGSSVEPYRAYLQERWREGCTMAKTLWHELRAQGFTGSYKSVCLFTRKFCVPETNSSASASPRRTVQQPRTPWQAKWLLLRVPEELFAADASYLQAIYCLSPGLAKVASASSQLCPDGA